MDNDKLSNIIDLLELAAYNALTEEGVLVDAIAHMDHIATDICNSCHRHGPVVVFHQFEVQCEACDPEAFEATARRDIEEWLAGADNFSR